MTGLQGPGKGRHLELMMVRTRGEDRREDGEVQVWGTQPPHLQEMTVTARSQPLREPIPFAGPFTTVLMGPLPRPF